MHRQVFLFVVVSDVASVSSTPARIQDFGLPPRSLREPRSSGLICSDYWQYLTNVSGQHIGSIFKGQESDSNFNTFLIMASSINY